jgi:NADH:ubiquinone oxidoreductase subunit H
MIYFLLDVFITILQVLLLIIPLVIAVAYFTLAERKMMA